MINVAFWYDRPLEYTGGLNYVKNLLYAISLANDGRIRPYLFIGRRADAALLQQMEPLATVVRTSVLDRKTPAWFLHKVLWKYAKRQWLVSRLMRRHRIDVVSHAEHVYGDHLPFRVISWVPDLQYLHLPELFPGLDAQAESRRWAAVVANSDAVVVSSQAACEDLRSILPEAAAERVRVLRFVSQPGWLTGDHGEQPDLAETARRNGFTGRFFFLPNQFWRHKNHRVVLEAVHLLKRRGIEILVLCSGNPRDYRIKDSSYIDSLREFIEQHGIGENIRLLGMIPYAEVLLLMRSCVAVLNPSRFEGWSSTVEEARSLGQRLVLSDIAVHKEQNPPRARYFPPDDPGALADILQELWEGPPEPITEAMRNECMAALRQRTLRYGRDYVQLVLEVAGIAPPQPTEAGIHAI